MKDSILEFHEYERLIHCCLHQWDLPEPYEDCLQESYLLYIRCLGKYDPSLSKFTTFFTASLHHHFQTMNRNHRRAKEAEHIYYLQKNPPQHEALQEAILLLDISSYSCFTAREQMVFEHSYSGYTLKEISHHTGKSLSTVKRARKQMKKKVSRVYQMEIEGM